MERKTGFGALVVVVVAVAVGGVLYAIAVVNGGTGVWTLATLVILVLLAVVAVAVAGKARKDRKSGFPKDDERSRAIRMRAGYVAFYISLYFLLAMGFVLAVLEDSQMPSLPTSEWAMVWVAAMGSIFLVVHAYFSRKGVPG